MQNSAHSSPHSAHFAAFTRNYRSFCRSFALFCCEMCSNCSLRSQIAAHYAAESRSFARKSLSNSLQRTLFRNNMRTNARKLAFARILWQKIARSSSFGRHIIVRSLPNRTLLRNNMPARFAREHFVAQNCTIEQLTRANHPQDHPHF